jgi:hypothetical protein
VGANFSDTVTLSQVSPYAVVTKKMHKGFVSEFRFFTKLLKNECPLRTKRGEEDPRIPP